MHDPRFPAPPIPPPPADPLAWPLARDRFLPLYLAHVEAGRAILRSFTNPKKTYLRTPSEIISYHSLQASESAWRHVMQGGLRDEHGAIRLVADLYATVMRHELELTFELYVRFLRRLPAYGRFRQVVFLARYEADGPSGSAEREAEHQLAQRFYDSVRVGLYGAEGARQMTANVYTATWQVGAYIERYEFPGVPLPGK